VARRQRNAEQILAKNDALAERLKQILSEKK
jgi:hypothetical protein